MQVEAGRSRMSAPAAEIIGDRAVEALCENKYLVPQ